MIEVVNPMDFAKSDWKDVMNGSLKLSGRFDVDHIRNGKLIGTTYGYNKVTVDGRNHMLGVTLKGTPSPSTTWYVGIFSGNYTVLGTESSSVLTSTFSQVTSSDLSNSVRPTFTMGSVSSGSVNNTSNKAAFTFTDSVTVYGAFIINDNDLAGVTGVLLSAANFTTSRSVIADDVLNVGYTISTTT
jgi:hypothetical protein